MKKPTEYSFENISSKRLLTMKEACFYTGMGRTKCRSFADQIGAVRKFGSRVLIDRIVIDKALNDMGA